MDIKFTKLRGDTNWVFGIVNDGEYTFEAKLFDEGSIYGINKGRVSKLTINDKHQIRDSFLFAHAIVNYDRGWDIEPETDEEDKIFEAVLEFLENAPKTII